MKRPRRSVRSLCVGWFAATASCAAYVDDGRSVDPIRAGAPDTAHAAVGFLVRRAATDGNCTVTLIHPRVALTAAHCLARQANRCATVADTRAEFEVAFTPTGVRGDAQRFAITDVAISPTAVPTPIAACPWPVYPSYACGLGNEELTVDPAHDIALLLLDRAVPASVAAPMTVVTGFVDTAPRPFTLHALLDAPTGVLDRDVEPTIIGWGVSDVCSDDRRNVGTMHLSKLPHDWMWHCDAVQRCDGAALYEWDECGGARGRHMSPLLRVEQSAPGSAYPARGDSGGPLVVRTRPSPDAAPREMVLGVLSVGTGNSDCHDPPTSSQVLLATSDYAPTFAGGNGLFIEATLLRWFTVWITPPFTLPPWRLSP